MRPQPKHEKLLEMSKLKRGDKIQLINGETVEFQTLKQKNFTALKEDGTLWNIPVNHFNSLVEKSEDKLVRFTFFFSIVFNIANSII